MAAFSAAASYQQQLLDYSSSPSIFQQPINNINALLQVEPNNNALFFPQFFQPDHQYLDQSTKVSSADDLVTNSTDTTNINEASAVLSVTNKNRTAAAASFDTSSIVTDHKYYDSSGKSLAPQKPMPMDKKRKSKEGSSASCAQSKDMREVKGRKQKKVKDGDEEKKEAPEGYIHVRARRGQATDSHSLAERVRREKISERMKLLQALVPGCEKVTGKALMLDEIINYVQSLQNQVEFLSLKLASVNPMLYDFGMDLESLMVKPDQNLSSLQSQLPSSMQQCSPTTAHNYPPLLLDNTMPPNHLLFHQQSQIPDTLPQGNRQVLWELDDQIRQNVVVNQSREPAIINSSSSLFSFH